MTTSLFMKYSIEYHCCSLKNHSDKRYDTIVVHFNDWASPFENPPRATQYEAPRQLNSLQNDVNQVVTIMKDNLDKVLERDANLAAVENRANALESGASQFSINAQKLKSKYWWKNVKMWIIIIIIIIVLIIVIVVAATQSSKGNNNGNQNNNVEEKKWFCLIAFVLLNRSNNGGGASPAAPGGSKRMAQQLAQVDEVVDIMRQNVDKVLERDKNLSLLDDRADKLQHNAAQFEQQAGKLKRKFWLQNMKMMIIMGVVGTILTIVIIGWIYSKAKGVVPALPANPAEGDADTTTPISSANDELPKVAGDSMAVPAEENATGKPRKNKRKKTTSGGSSASSSAAPTNKNDGSASGADTLKSVKKRLIRTLLQ
ncbi:unnamed protein product [Rotaria socialis]|uniref:V-SNARE coiled-coil homology domain-containing protein n=1 Tax=Rotaria socialis TaxID=392032 RepID=A0A820L7F0_9BILA|nr:unnamed protein product [Rotaria socialis]CAF4655272.1 unnamed protein product [Rotaria socialis]